MFSGRAPALRVVFVPNWRLTEEELQAHPECVHLPLVCAIAGEFWKRHGKRVGIDYEELLSVGWMELRGCWEQFDPGRGFKFSSYLSSSLRYAFWDLYYDRILPVRVPSTARSNARHTPENASAKRRARDQAVRTALEAPCGDAARAELPAPDPLADVIRTDELTGLKRALDALPPKDRDILKGRFGIDGHPVRKLRDLGKLLGVSRQRVHQVQASALRRLREALGPR